MPRAERHDVPDEAAMLTLGAAFANRLRGAELVVLEGELGAGKTTFARGVLRGLGYRGHVKSPTYTLVEPYELLDGTVYHLDLYRIVDPQELDFIGFTELLGERAIKLIEWPERAGARLPRPDAVVRIATQGTGRIVDTTFERGGPLERD
jgi:tRNA threonylcarbamoyladenosine biosynthesis protein TsaE